jgi:ABC-type transporter MlaC component
MLANGRVAKLLTAWCLGLMALVTALGEASAAECGAAAVVKQAAGSFVAASRSGSPGAYTEALSRHTSVPDLALFALGPYRNAMTGEKRAEYVRLTGLFVGRLLAEHGSRIVKGELVIDDCFSQNGAVLVKSRFGSTRVLWRVDGRRIGDVSVEGVWLAARLRTTFVAILRRAGGDVGALLGYLRGS